MLPLRFLAKSSTYPLILVGDINSSFSSSSTISNWASSILPAGFTPYSFCFLRQWTYIFGGIFCSFGSSSDEEKVESVLYVCGKEKVYSSITPLSSSIICKNVFFLFLFACSMLSWIICLLAIFVNSSFDYFLFLLNMLFNPDIFSLNLSVKFSSMSLEELESSSSSERSLFCFFFYCLFFSLANFLF